MNETIKDLLDLPSQVRRGDFVLRLSEGVEKADETLGNYVVTEQLVKCFDDALNLMKAAVQGKSSKGCYLHGSFGSGKSHFMAVLHLLLLGHTRARSIPQLAPVVAKHNDWTDGKRFLLLPYHMIGKDSMESAILGGYVAMIERLHPDAPTPGVYRMDSLLVDADNLRVSMGDATFFAQLNAGTKAKEDWGDLSEGWDAASYEQARNASPRSETRTHLVSALVDRFFTSAKSTSQFVELGDGLSIISRHAKDLGYDAVILFLDELILWLASRAADVSFVNREGPKLANLVEAQTAERPVPLVSFVARQRDLKELVGDQVTGADYLRFSDSLDWWEARFATIKLADSNLPAIAEKRVLKPKSEQARTKIDAAFAETASIRSQVMDVLMTRKSDRDMFRKIYPFSPAFMDTLVEMSFLLQRERTALKVMLQLLIEQGDRLRLGDIVPVGDLFDAIAEGDEAVSEDIRRRFDFAKKLYEEKFRPLLETEYQLRFEDLSSMPPEDPRVTTLRNDDRLVKTILLAALAPNVEALRGLNALRLAALNHGTIRSPIAGREAQVVLSKCRKWAAAIGQLKIGDDAQNPTITVQLSEVDTDTILDGAKSFDNPGNRVRLIRSLLFQELGIEDKDELMLRHGFVWRGTERSCNLLFKNLRELPLHSLLSKTEDWTVVVDWPFDEEGHGVHDDRALLSGFQEKHPEGSKTLVIQPSFLSLSALRDLGKLVILDQLLRGDNFANHSTHLSPANRETARTMLENQKSQLGQLLRKYLECAYGVSTERPEALDTANRLELSEHFVSLDPSFTPRPPAAANLRAAFADLLNQALLHQYPGHPAFDTQDKLMPSTLRKVLGEVLKATQASEGRQGVETALRKDMRLVANPLKLGSMEETHFLLGDHWKNHFNRKQAESGGALTVENLWAWMDEPNPTGLPELLRSLVVMVYAAQTNHTFFLHGSPVEPSLDSVKPEMELRTVDLPSESTWRRATERAGHLLGLTASQLVNAANVTRFCEDVLTVSRESLPGMEKLRVELDRLVAAGKIPGDCARCKTSKAGLELLQRLSALKGRRLVEALDGSPIEVADSAVGTALKRASGTTSALASAQWKTFEMLDKVPGHKADAAGRVRRQLDEALTSDEHVISLTTKLPALAEQALEIIQSALETPQPTPPAPTPVVSPDSGPVVAPPPPEPKGGKRMTGQKEIRASELAEWVCEVERASSGFREPKIRLQWEIYE